MAAALALLEDVDLAALDPAAVSQALRDVEGLQRRLGAVSASLLSQVHRHDLHTVDGHWSPRSMIRHLCALSGHLPVGRTGGYEACGYCCSHSMGGTWSRVLCSRVWLYQLIQVKIARRASARVG